MNIIEIHSRLAITTILYAVIMGIWGLWGYLRKQKVSSNYWGAMIISIILILVQITLGAYLYISGTGHLARAFIHVLYGIVALLIVPGIFLITRGEDARRINLIYGLAYFFLAAILVRAVFTGG